MQKGINNHVSRAARNRIDADSNEDNYSSVDGIDDNRLTFARSIPLDAPVL